MYNEVVLKNLLTFLAIWWVKVIGIVDSLGLKNSAINSREWIEEKKLEKYYNCRHFFNE